MTKIAIVGRPNTGKSTLFNQLTGTRDALVHNRPGVTRDVVAGKMKMPDDANVTLFDTAGLEAKTTDIGKISTDMALATIKNADAVLFVADAKAGLMPKDLDWARVVNRLKKPVLLLANKSESGKRIADNSEFYKLGFGTPIPISAEHKIGFDAIYDFVEKFDNKKEIQKTDLDTENNKELRIAIMGQPNVGKSTLVNRILGQNRMIVKDEPGITRDTVKLSARALGRNFTIMDTAGLRRKAGITDDVETLSALKSLDAIGKTDIVILIVDSTKNIENQALGIAGRVYDAGKILVVALNKWDLVDANERDAKWSKLTRQFENSFSQIIKPMIIPISAEKGTGVTTMLKRAFALWDISNTRAGTAIINRTIEKLVAAHQPPMSRLKRPMRIKFASQTKTHPMTVVINVGGASDIPDSYTRYLRRGIAKALNWEQLPIVIEYKKTENPFE
ncbi:MAG: ribosome biogenesis GTPase Der [Alphaproteobacteria bacterium]|nr:ribosome biogenesis GTPase Der [Alphaproteobacteria bacterium]